MFEDLFSVFAKLSLLTLAVVSSAQPGRFTKTDVKMFP